MARTRKLPQKQIKKPKERKQGKVRSFFNTIGRGIKKLFRPFRFLAKPFKTRPVRLIGRVLSKILLISYFKNSWQEVKQVTWPGRKETMKLSFAVFVFAITFAIFIAIVDFGLDKLVREVLL